MNIYAYSFIFLNVTYSVFTMLLSCIFSGIAIWYWITWLQHDKFYSIKRCYICYQKKKCYFDFMLDIRASIYMSCIKTVFLKYLPELYYYYYILMYWQMNSNVEAALDATKADQNLLFLIIYSIQVFSWSFINCFGKKKCFSWVTYFVKILLYLISK